MPHLQALAGRPSDDPPPAHSRASLSLCPRDNEQHRPAEQVPGPPPYTSSFVELLDGSYMPGMVLFNGTSNSSPSCRGSLSRRLGPCGQAPPPSSRRCRVACKAQSNLDPGLAILHASRPLRRLGDTCSRSPRHNQQQSALRDRLFFLRCQVHSTMQSDCLESRLVARSGASGMHCLVLRTRGGARWLFAQKPFDPPNRPKPPRTPNFAENPALPRNPPGIPTEFILTAIQNPTEFH